MYIVIIPCARVGCWLYLHCLDQLLPSVLHATCSLLSLIQQARQRGEAELQWMRETLKLSTDQTGVCFASISTPLTFPDYSKPPILLSSLAKAFKACSIESFDMTGVLKAMFSTHQFESASSLTDSLSTFCGALQELLQPLPPCATSRSELPPPHLSLHLLEMIVSLSQKHMEEFYSQGAISGEDEYQKIGGDGLHVSSMVYSEISESTRGSLRDRQLKGGEEINAAQQRSLHKQSLEEFSLVLALKNSVLCSMSPDSRVYSVIVKLINDVFPNCDTEGLIAHEMSVREGMAVRSRQNREAVESARESRAASVMQMMKEENQASEGMYMFHVVLFDLADEFTMQKSPFVDTTYTQPN